MTDYPPPMRREPAFNMPASVSGLILVLVAVHLVRTLLLSPMQDGRVILLFSFIPVRYTAMAREYGFPGGSLADLWTPLTYGLLHGSVTHLVFNVIWLAAFGSALARRFGTRRFLLFTALATVAGAAAHYVTHVEDVVPVVGASGAISGHMAAVARFMFQAGGPLRANRRDPALWHSEAVSLTGIWSDRRVLGFLAIWFGLNLLFGLGGSTMSGEDVSIAWEAHVGGFLFGLLAFSMFDPPASERARRAAMEVERQEAGRPEADIE